MIKCFISWVCLISLVFTIDVNFSLETKYGDGSKITGQASNAPDTTDYNFIENLLDINTIFDNGIFISTQLEYSDPPIFGKSVNGLNNFVVDYMGGNYSVKLGNIYSLYGRGLSLNMAQNQNIDYDNSVTGIECKYTLNDFNFFGIWGKAEFDYRSNPAFIQTDLRLDNDLYFIGLEYYHDKIGIFQYSALYEESKIGIDYINKYYSGNSDIGKELSYRFPDGLPENVNSEILKTIDQNIAWNHQLFGTDFYIEKVWNTYTKILGDTESGSKLYMSLYFDIIGTGITYEYKNYDQKYYIPTLSAAPIVFREGNSTLASRNSHSINWGDEVGHQIELNRSIGDFQLMSNLSFAYKHEYVGSDAVSLSQVFKMDNESAIYHQYPFRQFYSELSGYSLNDKLYFKLGIDQFDEFKMKGDSNEGTSARTFPSMFTFNIGGGNSITSYIEYQNRDYSLRDANLALTRLDNYKARYISLTYNYINFLSFSIFYDDERFEKKVFDIVWDEGINIWRGYDITAELNSSSQLSVFYGSQKGGLICANGVCAEQPGFDDGIKVTLRTIF
jgi:hypothetical protein